MKQKGFYITFRIESDGWYEQVRGNGITHRLDATVVHSQYEHAKMAPGMPVVIRSGADVWPEDIPTLAKGDVINVYSLRKVSTGAPGHTPSFILQYDSNRQPRSVALTGIR